MFRYRVSTWRCPKCGHDKGFAATKSNGKPVHCDWLRHYKFVEAAACQKCGVVTCPECKQTVDVRGAEIRGRVWTGVFLVLFAAGLLVYEINDEEPVKRSWCDEHPGSSLCTGGLSDSACDEYYFDESSSTWLDAEAVAEIPGCAGYLPPPPERLPGLDQDCDDIAQGPVRVDPTDRYGLDEDGDGVGCEPFEG